MSTTPEPTPDPSAKPDATPYELEPDAPKPPPKKAEKQPELNAPGLIDDFDEDADFDTPDPTPAVVRPAPPAAEPASDKPPFVRPGKLPIKVVLIAAAVVTITSIVLSVRASGAPWYAEILYSIYVILLHSIAGVVAVTFASWVAERDVGHPEVAFVRMVAAVAAVRGIFALDIPIPGTGVVDELVLAVGAYCLLVGILFKLSKRDWQIVVATHFILSLLLMMGGQIETWHASVTPKPPPTPAVTP